jgi:hypothetical protein
MISGRTLRQRLWRSEGTKGCIVFVKTPDGPVKADSHPRTLAPALQGAFETLIKPLVSRQAIDAPWAHRHSNGEWPLCFGAVPRA